MGFLAVWSAASSAAHTGALAAGYAAVWVGIGAAAKAAPVLPPAPVLAAAPLYQLTPLKRRRRSAVAPAAGAVLWAT